VAKNDGWVTVRISEQERDELERLATQEERTMNGMIRLAIKQLLLSRQEAAA
jgi:predicted transcriptional regulator